MAYNFRILDRDQMYLMPPRLKEWLPEDDLAWFVMDAVSQVDLKKFHSRYREDGRGNAAYDPSMMVSLLLYIQLLHGGTVQPAVLLLTLFGHRRPT